ncbi:MAG: hypothetical protein BWX48_01305 [Verrucomicrobia bacterium ADurb.Bin006]|nr:MAG: hypothetical protein BWX48_01305 [Verrucomicrobia bacterium ADurb.Bin006]
MPCLRRKAQRPVCRVGYGTGRRGRLAPRGADFIPTDNLQMLWITRQDGSLAVRPNASLGSGACDRRLGTRVREDSVPCERG